MSSTPPPLDRIVVPTTTLFGAIMRIGNHARMTRRPATIELDPASFLEFRKTCAEEFGGPHYMLNHLHLDMCFSVDGVLFKIKDTPTDDRRSPIPPSGACC